MGVAIPRLGGNAGVDDMIGAGCGQKPCGCGLSGGKGIGCGRCGI